jgi:hypothetical protein
MIYEIIDMETGNVIGAYDSERAALLDLQHAVNEHGRVWLLPFALVRDDEFGRGTILAEGDAIYARLESLAA